MPHEMRRLLRHSLGFVLCGGLAITNIQAATPNMLGYWREPSGAVIGINPCGPRLCLDLLELPPAPSPSSDLRNPNRKLRGRPLCGLRIGEDFIERDLQHAEGGHLYDPRSGRTYQASMTADGDRLRLRGYLGLKLFGRTETWTRVPRPSRPCHLK